MLKKYPKINTNCLYKCKYFHQIAQMVHIVARILEIYERARTKARLKQLSNSTIENLRTDPKTSKCVKSRNIIVSLKLTWSCKGWCWSERRHSSIVKCTKKMIYKIQVVPCCVFRPANRCFACWDSGNKAAVSCSSIGPMLGGVGFVVWWRARWAVHGWVHGVVLVLFVMVMLFSILIFWWLKCNWR